MMIEVIPIIIIQKILTQINTIKNINENHNHSRNTTRIN